MLVMMCCLHSFAASFMQISKEYGCTLLTQRYSRFSVGDSKYQSWFCLCTGFFPCKISWGWKNWLLEAVDGSCDALGVDIGDTIGFREGNSVGCLEAVWLLQDWTLGRADVEADGLHWECSMSYLSLGCEVGWAECTSLGTGLGKKEGLIMETPDGEVDGCMEWNKLGISDGLEVRSGLGSLFGIVAGRKLGVADSNGVGNDEGCIL